MPSPLNNRRSGWGSFPPLGHQISNPKTTQSITACQRAHLEDCFPATLSGIDGLSGNQSSYGVAMARYGYLLILPQPVRAVAKAVFSLRRRLRYSPQKSSFAPLFPKRLG